MTLPPPVFQPLDPAVSASAPAVIDGDDPQRSVLTHGALRAAVAQAAAVWPAPPRSLTLIAATWSPVFVIAYLAAHAAGQAVCLVDPGRPWQATADRLRPDVIVTDDPTVTDGVLPGLALARMPGGERVHDALSLLLPTSGSTGSPRLVRLAGRSLEANGRAIIAALSLSPAEVAVGHLAPWYSYGLSVLHTHLMAGSCVVVTRRGPMDGGFWDMLRDTGATTLPGVPFHYQMLRRFDLDRLDIPALRILTQAGGRLDPRLVEHFARLMAARGGRFLVMYGQTEAGPRIAAQTAEGSLACPDAVGRPLPGTAVTIEHPDGALAAPGEVGEVVVRGPGVMMGYAETRADLMRGDDLGGTLRTGDRGSLDAAGMLTLAGRQARFAKLFGLRLDLEAIERAMEGPTVAVEKGDRLILVTEGNGEDARRAAVSLTGLTPAVVLARPVAALPRLPSGKIDLRAVEAMA